MWSYIDDEPAKAKDTKLQPDGTPYPKVTATKRTVGDYFTEAYDRATSLSGEGEIGALGRGIEDLFNLNDRFDQALGYGTPEQREDMRDQARVQKTRQARALWRALDEADPAWRKDGNVFGNVARFTSGLLGDLAGNANPDYLIGAGKNVVQRVAAQAGVSGAVDAGLQANEMREGIQDEFDPKRLAYQILAGGAFQGGVEGLGKAFGKIRERFAGGGEAPDFNSDEFARETIEGAADIELTDANFAQEMQDALQGGASPAEIEAIYKRYGKTPEERIVSSDYGADAPFADADERFTNSLVTGKTDADLARPVPDAEEIAPVAEAPVEVEAPNPERSAALVELRKLANDMHMDAETDGGKYPLAQLVAVNKKITEKLDEGSLKGADLEEAQNIKAFLDEAIVYRDPTIQTGEAEIAASGPPPVEPVDPNVGGGGGELPPVANDISGGGEPPKPPVIERLTDALNNAERVTNEQKRMYTEQRRERLKELIRARQQGEGGEAGFRQELSQLKGEFDKAEFNGVRDQFDQEEIDGLFKSVEEREDLSIYDQVNARTGLVKVLDGQVPQPSELSLLKKVFGPEFVKAVAKHTSKRNKALDALSNALNLPRSLMSSFDLSAPLRQGIFMTGRKEFWKAWGTMFKSFGSEKAFRGVMDDIRSRPNYPLMEDGKLAVTEVGSDLSKREEDFISTWAEKIPLVGRGVKASERAYVGFLNKVRADVFDDIVSKYQERGIDIDVKSLSRYINSATGRGDLGKLNAAAPLLNGLFFSPRLIKSRVDLLNPAFYVGLEPSVRKEAVRDLLAFGGIATTVASLASLGGMEVETDPRSSDFAKLKTGDTRYDILGGFGQYLTLGARLLTNEKKTMKGKVQELGPGLAKDSRLDVTEKFFENKFSPVASFVRDFLAGENPIGEEFETKKAVVERFIPLFLQDAYELMNEEGYLKGAAMSAPGMFGVGIGHYGDKPKASEQEEDITPASEPTQQSGWKYVD